MAAYRAAARQRQQQKKRKLELRFRLGWEVAREAAKLLKEQFGCQQVILFGSLLCCDRFHDRSDLDLAVWGMDEGVYYKAVSHLLDLEPTIPVDLVQAEFAPAYLLKIIEQEGITL